MVNRIEGRAVVLAALALATLLAAPGAGTAQDRPRVGITLDPMQSAEVDARGARVEGLLPDGPADEAGLERGDVVTSFGGHVLMRPLDGERERDFDLDRSLPVQRLLVLAHDLEPGQEVDLTYLRDGEERTATVRARELDRWGARRPRLPRLDELRERLRVRMPREAPRVRPPAAPRRPEIARGLLHACPESVSRGSASGWPGLGPSCPGGLRLVAMNPGLAEYFGTEEGVLVVDVHPESALGLESGDVLVRIGTRTVDSPERAARILGSYEPDEAMTLHVVRDGRPMEVRGRSS